MGGQFGCPLAAAAGARHKAMVELLLRRGANINAQDENGETALGYAVAGGELEIVKLLLHNNANVNLGENDCYPLRISASRGQREIFHLLLEYGAEVSCVNLGVAATGGNIVIMQFCLENGGDVNERDENNGCALQTAAFMGHTEAVRFLLDHGADPNIQGGQSGNALQAAVRADSVGIVNMLLDAGAEDVEDRIWGSALKTANNSISGNRMLIIQALQASLSSRETPTARF
jgi:ankyrin repeat protein